MSKHSRYYVYKMTGDDGGAPHVSEKEGLLSLAICKPQIRSTCQVGDIVIGIGGEQLGGKLIYVARITDRLERGDYYRTENGYTGRADCIYRWKDDDLEWRPGSLYHKDGLCTDTDIGQKPYSKANVLLSNSFVYFGASGTRSHLRFPKLHEMIDRLTQGHRVNHPGDRLVELKEMVAELGMDSARILGKPHESPQSSSCNHSKSNDDDDQANIILISPDDNGYYAVSLVPFVVTRVRTNSMWGDHAGMKNIVSIGSGRRVTKIDVHGVQHEGPVPDHLFVELTSALIESDNIRVIPTGQMKTQARDAGLIDITLDFDGRHYEWNCEGVWDEEYAEIFEKVENAMDKIVTAVFGK